MATYKYKPIDLSKDAIRLVRLLAGPYLDPIRCERSRKAAIGRLNVTSVTSAITTTAPGHASALTI